MCILFSIVKFLLRFHHEECHWEKKCRQNFFISWNGGWKLEKEVVKLTGWKMFDSLSLEFKWIFCLHQPEEWNIFFYRHGSYGSQGHSTPTSRICCCASANPFMTVSAPMARASALHEHLVPICVRWVTLPWQDFVLLVWSQSLPFLTERNKTGLHMLLKGQTPLLWSEQNGWKRTKRFICSIHHLLCFFVV